MFVSLASALFTALSADLRDYDDKRQAALELATVTGFGTRNHPNLGNTDEGDYVAVAYYEISPGQWFPYTVQFQMSGPQGSLGDVKVSSLLGGNWVDIDHLIRSGLWQDGQPEQ